MKTHNDCIGLEFGDLAGSTARRVMLSWELCSSHNPTSETDHRDFSGPTSPHHSCWLVGARAPRWQPAAAHATPKGLFHAFRRM